MADEWPTAGDLMVAEPITIGPEAPIAQALGLMRAKSFHELPVLRRSKLVGMVTFESIARRSNLPLSTKVGHLLALPPLVTVATPIAELAEQLLASGFRAAPVVGRRGELVGIVSRTDLVRAFAGLPSVGPQRVEEVSSPVNLVIRETDRVGSLFAQLRALEEHPLPVADRKGRLVGAVGVSDLGRVLWRPVLSGKKDARTGQQSSVYDVEVGTIMHSPPVTVSVGTTATEAARVMTAERVSSAFVLEHGRAVGIVSQTDLLGLIVAAASAQAGGRLEDVYVQITGLRGSSDAELLTEIDRVVARGLRHVARHARPSLLSLHFAPHATHRTSDATVEARLHTDRGTFYASHTGWNLLAGIALLMDELLAQTRRIHDHPRHRTGRSRDPTAGDEPATDPDLEARIRNATEVEAAPRRRRRT